MTLEPQVKRTIVVVNSPSNEGLSAVLENLYEAGDKEPLIANDLKKAENIIKILKKNGYTEKEISPEKIKNYEFLSNLAKAGLCITLQPGAHCYIVGIPNYQGKIVALNYNNKNELIDAEEMIKTLI